MTTNVEGRVKINDPFYRYTREIVIIEKRKNTCAIKNLDKIAINLDRELEYLSDYLKHKLNLRFKSSNKEFVTTKTITVDEIELALKDYIDEQVLCTSSKCSNPETYYYLDDKTQKVRKSCKACGFTSSVKNTHIRKTILKNLKKDL